jgi:hypothetical protein
MGRYGPPDLICETAGDLTRCYLPGQQVEYVWPSAERTLYYLGRGQQVTIAPDGTERITTINTEERRRVRDRLARIRASTTSPTGP